MRHALGLATVLAAAGLVVPAAMAGDEGEALRARLEAVAPSIAVVKCTLHTKWSEDGVAGEHEDATEARGAVVDPSGIVIVHGSAVGAESARGAGTSPRKVTAEDLRVILPPDATERPAAVLLSDARLGLAFLQVLDLGKTRLPAVDLTKSAVPRLGQTLAGVTRDTEGYGYAAGVWTLYVSGRLEKPAAMWLAGGDFDATGLPVFTLEGLACGVISEQTAVEGAAEEDEPASRTVILPLESVLKSLEAARKKVPETLARVDAERKARAAAKAEGKDPGDGTAKEPEKPAAPKEPAAPEKPGTEPAQPPEQPR